MGLCDALFSNYFEDLLLVRRSLARALMVWNICLDHLSALLSICKVYCGKTAERIRMLFGVVSRVGQGIGVLDRVVIVKGNGQFRG